MGGTLNAKELTTLEKERCGEMVREDGKGGLRGRVGGAVTLAVGMASVFSSIPGLRGLMSYFYHFVIMFEALFILTLLETGTRVARFVFQETVAQFTPRAAIGHKPNWAMNVVMSVLTCFCWGFLLYLGDLGTLWSMLGIANQLLAAIALAIGTTYLLMHAPKRKYALCTAIPFVFVMITTVAASVGKIQQWLGKPPEDQTFLLKLACVLAVIMLALTAIIALDTIRRWVVILRRPAVSAEPTVAAPPAAGRGNEFPSARAAPARFAPAIKQPQPRQLRSRGCCRLEGTIHQRVTGDFRLLQYGVVGHCLPELGHGGQLDLSHPLLAHPHHSADFFQGLPCPPVFQGEPPGQTRPCFFNIRQIRVVHAENSS